MYKGLNWEKSKEFGQKYFVFVIYAEKGNKNCVIFSVTFSNISKNLLSKNFRGNVKVPKVVMVLKSSGSDFR